jgi:hypothetical protein
LLSLHYFLPFISKDRGKAKKSNRVKEEGKKEGGGRGSGVWKEEKGK